MGGAEQERRGSEGAASEQGCDARKQQEPAAKKSKGGQCRQRRGHVTVGIGSEAASRVCRGGMAALWQQSGRLDRPPAHSCAA